MNIIYKVDSFPFLSKKMMLDKKWIKRKDPQQDHLMPAESISSSILDAVYILRIIAVIFSISSISWSHPTAACLA